MEKQYYAGAIMKCPNCGEIIQPFSTICSTCGIEFRNVAASQAISNLQKQLESIKYSSDIKTRKNIFGAMMDIGKVDEKTCKMIQIIQNFAIPNTREDIVEFITLANTNINVECFSDFYYSNIQDKMRLRALSEAWIAKMEQAYQKSCMWLQKDEVFEQIEKIYKNRMNEIKNIKKKSKIYIVLIALAPIVLSILIGLSSWLVLLKTNPEKQLNHIYQQIQIDINSGRYDEALIKANELRVSKEYSQELANLWDEKRENVIKIINEIKGER